MWRRARWGLQWFEACSGASKIPSAEAEEAALGQANGRVARCGRPHHGGALRVRE
jgi:hypothetical protein